MKPSPGSKAFDLSDLVSEVKDREAVVVLSAEGQVIASDFDPTGQKPDWLEEVHALATTMTSLFQDSSVSGLDRALVEGSKKKLVVHRNQRLGYFVVIIGPETMNIGLAGFTAKNISSAIESSLRPKT